MSWKRYSSSIVWYNLFKGVYTEQPIGDIPHVPSKSTTYLQTAQNVFAPGIAEVLRKRPGFTKVRASAINASGIVTGMVHLGEIADEFLLAVSIAGTSHNVYRDNANPPGAVAAGTNFTIGQDNLVDWTLFHDGTNPGAIACSRLRDTPQFFTSAVVRTNFAITGTTLPQFGEVFGQRFLMGAPSVGGTVFDDRVYYSKIRDGDAINDTTTDFLTFETKEKDRVRAIRKMGDLCIVGKLHNLFRLDLTPFASQPFVPREIHAGQYRGPVSQQATIAADGRLWWIGQTNIHSIDLTFQLRDWADAIKPTIAGLSDTRREFAIAGYDSTNGLVLFAVSDGSDATHKTVIALNPKTGALYLWTLSRNAFAQRLVSSDNRLIGGGYTGFFYNEVTGTAGDLDDATAIIDADVVTPRFWMGGYGQKTKVPFVFLSVDPVATEQITVQYRIDDDQSWSTPSESPIIVSGTDTLTKALRLDVWAERVQLRIRNNRTDEVYSIKAVGIPGLPMQPSVN